METHEAISTLRQFANAFKAAKRLDEVLESAQKIETLTASLERRNADLEAEAGNLRGEIDKLKAMRAAQDAEIKRREDEFMAGMNRQRDALTAKSEEVAKREKALFERIRAVEVREAAADDHERSARVYLTKAEAAMASANSIKAEFESKAAKLKTVIAG